MGLLPLELVAASITLEYWTLRPDGTHVVHVAVWITIFWAAIILVNLFGSLGFAEEECELTLAREKSR